MADIPFETIRMFTLPDVMVVDMRKGITDADVVKMNTKINKFVADWDDCEDSRCDNCLMQLPKADRYKAPTVEGYLYCYRCDEMLYKAYRDVNLLK